MDKYKLGVGSHTVIVESPSIEAALLKYTTAISSNVPLDLIAIYEKNGEPFTDKNPFAVRSIISWSPKELAPLMQDVVKSRVLEDK